MKKTVLCHFYNEEWILPWWLRHHREIFDHGIMLDYHSTDRSVDIIRELCPTWEIHTSVNKDFSPQAVDNEVMNHEANLQGWRICLNATEFMVGNYNHLDDRSAQTNYYLGQWMLVDMERREEPYYMNHNKPIWEQRWWGYGIVADFAKNQSHGSVPRAPRSIHNYPFRYPVVGRHFPGSLPSHSDLAIFYAGYASLEDGSIKRKMQIQTQCPHDGAGTNHKFTLHELLDRFRKEQQPMARDLREELRPYIEAHEAWVSNKQNTEKNKTKEEIQNAINALQSALTVLQ